VYKVREGVTLIRRIDSETPMDSRLLIKHTNQVNLYFTDLHHRAVQLPVYRRTWDDGAYVVEVSSVVPIAVNAYLAVPRFGYTWDVSLQSSGS